MTERSTIWTWDVLTHTIAGLVALVAGALMFAYEPLAVFRAGAGFGGQCPDFLAARRLGDRSLARHAARAGVVWGVWVDSSGFTFATCCCGLLWPFCLPGYPGEPSVSLMPRG